MIIFKASFFSRYFSEKNKHYIFFLISLLAIVLVIVGATLTQNIYETRLKSDKGELITIVLQQAQTSLVEKQRSHENVVSSWARTPIISNLAKSLLQYPNNEEILKDTQEQEVLREILSPLVDAGDYEGFFILSTEKINLASHFGVNLGIISDIPEHILDRAMAGHAATSLPQRANIPMPDLSGNQVFGLPTMFTVAPIENQSGEVIALFALRINPVKGFSSILLHGRLGRSGETYVFNKTGQLLSESRFLEDLRNLGILESNKQGILNMQLRDPGVDMMKGYRSDTPRSEQPLTLMAKMAIEGRNGINLEGYNDYKGTPVIGAWSWSEDLGMGIATEIDVKEAYSTLRLSRYLMIGGAVFSIFIIVALAIVFTVSRKRVAKSEVNLLTAQRIAHLGSWVWDIANDRLEWSLETYKIFRQDPEQFEPTFEKFISMTHPSDRGAVKSAVDKTMNHSIPYKVEHRVICPDGTEKIVLEQAVIERDIHDEPAFLHGSALDITDRKKAEQELKLFKTTSDLIEDSLFMFDPDSLKLFYVNQAAIQQLGYSDEEFYSMTPIDFTPHYDDMSFRAMLEPLTNGSKSIVLFQTEHQRKNGSRVPVDIVLQYLDPKGENARFVAIVRDFSERQKIENQLKSEKEKAEMANRLKSEFLANMSHEIRTPMNGVLGMLELLEITRLEDKQNSYVNTAKDSAKSLLTIINDILDFSKIEAGHMQLESTTFNLHNVVEDSVSSMSNQAETGHLDLNCYIAPGIPVLVTGDPVRLRQVITNLINNAIKFTKSGEVNFRLLKLSEDNDQVRMSFEVEDTGIGVDQEKADSLFDAFSQADGSTTRKYGGTGLGLSICKQLVSMMGGEMSVNSKSGSGSIFSFSTIFPIVDYRVEKPAVKPPEELRVLVVDHNDTNRDILCNYLSSWDIQNSGVADSYEALPALRDALAKNRPYHVLLLDYFMPKIDGVKLAGMIKADEELQDIHLIMQVSSKQKHEEADSDIECNLVKPVKQSYLFDALLQVTGRIEKPSPEHDKIIDNDVVFSDAKVLLVDDVATNQAVGLEMLNELGINPVLASDGREALRMLKNSDFDIVFMDCQMPVMDGFTATEIIRAQEKAENLEHLTVIALTANAMKGDKEACILAGMDDYLAKPIDMDSFRRILKKWLPDAMQQIASSQVNPEEETVTVSKSNVVDIVGGVLDENTLNNLVKLAGKRFISLIGKFEKDIDKNLVTLREAIKQNDVEKMVSSVHAMKGAAASMAAVQFSECCKTLEMQARENAIVDVSVQMKRIEDAYQNAISELKKIG